MSFEAPAMEVVGLKMERSGEERDLRLNVFVGKKKKKKGDVVGQDWLA